MYRGIAGKEKGIIVSDEDAFLYALEQVKDGDEKLKKEFVEFFYSGDYIYESEDTSV